MTSPICLRAYYDPEEALIVKGALCAYGVDARLDNEHHLSVNPFLRVGLGGYRLTAPAEQELLARQILAELETRPPDDPVGADDPCPECGGLEFRRHRSRGFAVIAASLGIPFAPYRGAARCRACGADIAVARPPLWPWLALLGLALFLGLALIWPAPP